MGRAALPHIPFRPAPVRPSFAEPPPTQVLRADHADPLAPSPALAVGWRLPDPVADLPATWRSSRWPASCPTASRPGCSPLSSPRRTWPPTCGRRRVCWVARSTPATRDVFVLGAFHPLDVTAEQVLDACAEQIGRVAAQGPDEDELARSLARFASTLYRDNDAIASRTRSLGSLELLHGRAELLAELPDLLSGITGPDIAAAAATLDPERCAQLRIVPEPRGRQ